MEKFLYPEEDAPLVGGESNGGYFSGGYSEEDEDNHKNPQARNEERELSLIHI